MTGQNEKILTEAPIKAVDRSKVSKKSEEKVLEGLSWAGKMFFAGAAAYILGKNMNKMKLPIKLRGDPQKVRAVIDAIASSKRFQQELNRPGATIDSVIDKLKLRNLTKSKFREITGQAWPL